MLINNSEGIKEYTWVGYLILGYFRVQVPKIYEKRVRVISGWSKNFQVNLLHNFNP